MKGVKGVYGGSSGECIYQSVAERKLVLENVMEAAQGKLTVIAHVACNNTRDSVSWPATPRAWGWTPSPPSPHLLPPARLRHRPVLERHERRGPQHRLLVIYNIP